VLVGSRLPSERVAACASTEEALMPWHRACIEYGRDCSDTGISIEGGSRCRVHQRAAWRNAKPRPDFLTANDAWFMPVVQKTGPDGCLYVLDWYDRYHCYQDARRDPQGIDRLNGRRSHI
jgi:hypothetical protein